MLTISAIRRIYHEPIKHVKPHHVTPRRDYTVELKREVVSEYNRLKRKNHGVKTQLAKRFNVSCDAVCRFIKLSEEGKI